MRKYVCGEKITYTLDAVYRILEGEWLMVGTKPMHPGWCTGWALRFIELQVARGVLHVANLNPEWVTKHRSDNT